MAKSPQQPAAPSSPAASRSSAAQPATGTSTSQVTELTEEQREAAEKERKAQEDAARQASTEQGQQQAKGETGQAAADAVKGADGAAAVQHTISDPKAAPVDYTRETMRRPPHTVLPVDKAEPKAVAVRPYGSEPRNIDTATGLDVAPETGDENAGEAEDPRDADTDRGSTAGRNKRERANKAASSR